MKKIVLSLTLSMSMLMLTLTGCGASEQPVDVPESNVAEAPEKNVDMYQEAAGFGGEVESKSVSESDTKAVTEPTATPSADDGTTLAKYTVDDINNLILTDCVRMYCDTEGYSLDITRIKDDMFITINNKVSEMSMDIYAMEKDVYAKYTIDGTTKIVKTAATDENNFTTVSPEVSAFESAEYLKTIIEDGKNYDVIEAKEKIESDDDTDTAEGQTYWLYVNTETNFIDFMELKSDGSRIYIEKVDEFEVPDEVINNAEELEDPSEIAMTMMSVMFSGQELTPNAQE